MLGWRQRDGRQGLVPVMAALVSCLVLSSVPAATIQVGPSRTYNTPSTAQSHVSSGDTVEIDAATYTADCTSWTQNNLILRGVGGCPKLNANGAPANGKAIWVIDGTNTTVENIEFYGAQLTSAGGGNGAGIRQESATLTLRHCCFHDNNNGILVNASATSDILIEYCEFYNNGYTNVADNPGNAYVGYAHNMYIGNVRTFTLRYSYSHDSRQGHLVKSRANTNYILYNRITEQAGQGSYEVQLAQGGLSFLVGNLIEKGVNAVNHSRIISYSDEGTKNTNQTLYVANNTVVSDLAGYSPTFVCIDASAPSPSGKIVNNLFIGSGAMTSGVGAVVLTNNLALTLAQSAQLVNRTGYDYHLVPFAAAIDKGVAPGVYSNFDLTPVYHYVHPTNSEPRPVEAALDLGAYECADANGNGIEDNWERRYFGSLTNQNGAANADPDHDGFSNLQEYLADTDPTNPASFLALDGLVRTNGGERLAWKGGTSVWQYVEYRRSLVSTGETWAAIFTNPPPMAAANSLFLPDSSNAVLFYRVRAVRP